MTAAEETPLEDNPQWYRDAVIYQLHIKAFRDADGNGVGDLRGLMEKLDYLHNLGVNALWLLPFYPSPLKDDGYDIADYFRVNPSYNTLREFKAFLRAAHRRGIRVITELVLNHTSDQHPWFQRARRARPGSVYRDFYVWSDTAEKYRDTRIIFQDFESSNWSWDPVAKAYYWHRFYSHQPDLNFDSPRVRQEMLRVLDFWFGMGVDGVRLDAVPYLYEREGTNCENLPETHAFLRELRAHVEDKFNNRMLLAEANQWPEDAVAYFGAGDECHMNFHFPLMPRMFMALQMEDRFPILDILDQTPPLPEGCQWAVFLRNHDELTLEMVTDEERDYMYRVYASDPRARINLGIRRRLAPLLGNSRRKMELMNILLFSLPGTPIIYYGDEIGMGDNYYLGDRDGVRTPMQWSPDRNAGFSSTNPQQLYLPVIIEPEYHFESVNVENQERSSSSLLWWMRRVIAMRKRYRAFGRGTLEMLTPENPKILAFTRSWKEETVLVVVNLSRFAQVAQLDLSAYAGMIPEEVFSRNPFPLIRETPYVLTLGMYGYFWFRLRPSRESDAPAPGLPRLRLAARRPWSDILAGRSGEGFAETIVPPYLRYSRWFRGKARDIGEVHLQEVIPLGREAGAPRLVLCQLSYTDGGGALYALPLAWLPAAQAEAALAETPQARIALLQCGEEEGILFDALYQGEARQALLQLVARRQKLRGGAGELVGLPGSRFRRLRGSGELDSRLLRSEQSNSSLLYGETFFLKLYRELDGGINPDPELTRFLTERARFVRTPPFAGTLEYHRPGEEPMVVGLLQGAIANQGDAWRLTLDVLSRLIERLLAHRRELPPLPVPCRGLQSCDSGALSPPVIELFGGFFLEMAALLGRRTAELHLALAGERQDAAWRPEPFSLLYQRSVYQSMRNLLRRALQQLERALPRLAEEDRALAEGIRAAEPRLLALLGRVKAQKLSALKIRIHGDYHLGQVLFTGKDFAIIDFEGEPARPLSERRLKRSPLRDVAGMLRSFHYAANTALRQHGAHYPADTELLAPWLEAWQSYVGGTFLTAYLTPLEGGGLIPADAQQQRQLLDVFLLEKAVYELGYELNNRPDWVAIPLQGLAALLAGAEDE